MILVYCRVCGECFNLEHSAKMCRCGETRGKLFEDGVNAEVHGPVALFIISDNTFADVLDADEATSHNFSVATIPTGDPRIFRH